ncbi:hypothetical protein BKG82_27765 [Mycobacteroides chelonae]|uniref:Uncharacterized protein n=1 Tax=Mycobacteroides chelonae TaxID=1774 RepID=A0A1S1LJ42_MYCCH|nr:hypothetical protein BKG82_27765 [Mycobacteroides chelonae]
MRYKLSEHHCREGLAVAKDCDSSVVLVDTFWQGGSQDDHMLTEGEVSTAELIFNLEDYDELERYVPSSKELWNKYAPIDRQVVTSQHGSQERLFIRKGATPDWDTQIETARQVVAERERQLESATRGLEWARHDLAEVSAAASAARNPQ